MLKLIRSSSKKAFLGLLGLGRCPGAEYLGETSNSEQTNEAGAKADGGRTCIESTVLFLNGGSGGLVHERGVSRPRDHRAVLLHEMSDNAPCLLFAIQIVEAIFVVDVACGVLVVAESPRNLLSGITHSSPHERQFCIFSLHLALIPGGLPLFEATSRLIVPEGHALFFDNRWLLPVDIA